jgi:hypothetical protein
MERKAYWYSVVQYSPNYIQGEKINVGLMLHDPDKGKIIYKILDENNQKVKALLSDEVLNKTYKVHKDTVEFYIDNLPDQASFLDPDAYSFDFLNKLTNELPAEFILSEPTLTLTDKPSDLFHALLAKYIGENFLKDVSYSQVRTVKSRVREFFEEQHWIGTKIKQNAKLKPKELQNMQFQIDFVFKNGIWNLIQTVPSNEERLTDWFSKTRTMIDAYTEESTFYVMFNDDDILNKDKTIEQMIDYLKRKDERVNEVEIESSSFQTLCEKVEKEARDISSLTDELIAL